MTDSPPLEDLAMQFRCLACRKEQYGPAVYPVSTGKEPCPWCGEMATPMRNAEYRAALDAMDSRPRA